MSSYMASLTYSSLSLSRPHLNCFPSPTTSLISLTCRQGVSSHSSLAVLAAVSPLVRAVLPSCCPHLPTSHLLLPQFEEAVVAKLVQFVAGGMVVASLRECSQVLEMLQVLGVDTKHVVLEKNEERGEECEKEETECDAPDGEDDEVEEVSIVYEGQSSNVPRTERISFHPVKTEPAEAATENLTDENSASSEISRARLTPLLSPTPPAASSRRLSSSSQQAVNFQDLVTAGMVSRRNDKRGQEMLRVDIGQSSKKNREM
eukprot:GFUD01019557.1.p1 GENE.GFUD01019557.1~~GFUD01019557.1.p1  ORF type:complete len:260 (-),score=128.63 GFUD01019557.1:46-825(-)